MLEALEAAGQGRHMIFLAVKGRDGIRTIQCISKSSKAMQVPIKKYLLPLLYAGQTLRVLKPKVKNPCLRAGF